MKLIRQFHNFLVDEVNLNQTRIDTLESRVQIIERFLRNSDWVPEMRDFSPQGSWAHRTIIKPKNGNPFDADLVLFVDPLTGWTAADYVVSLRAVFRASDRYRDLASMSTRCATLTYAGDFCLDVVPCVVDRLYQGTLEVCNRRDNRFEPTSPLHYTQWLAERNDWLRSNQLQHVVRLLKFLRDIKGTFSVKSVLLTTLIGMQLTPLDAQQRGEWFPDLPTTLRVFMARLDTFLQSYVAMPTIWNPVLPTEEFNRHWDQEKYENFRSRSTSIENGSTTPIPKPTKMKAWRNGSVSSATTSPRILW